MTKYNLSEKIRDVENWVKERYSGNNSTTKRAFDKEYCARLENLKDLYIQRNSNLIIDVFGNKFSDKRRAKIVEEVLVELAEERMAVAKMFCSSRDAGL